MSSFNGFLGTVHVTISEGQGVQVVGQTVQEYLNSADVYTICDSKGIAIADSAETKGKLKLPFSAIQFWVPGWFVYSCFCLHTIQVK